jgi:ribosome-binding factor A
MKVKKNNLSLQAELAKIVNQEIELPNALVTIINVKTDNNVSEIRAVFSVIPENFTGTALKKLKKKTVVIVKKLQKKAFLKRLPKIIWLVENYDKNIDELEQILNSLSD